jgi:hypothetical protein
MDSDDLVPPPVARRSPYAVPYEQFTEDAHVDRAELVVEQPYDHPAASPAPAGTFGDDGD